MSKQIGVPSVKPTIKPIENFGQFVSSVNLNHVEILKFIVVQSKTFVLWRGLSGKVFASYVNAQEKQALEDIERVDFKMELFKPTNWYPYSSFPTKVFMKENSSDLRRRGEIPNEVTTEMEVAWQFFKDEAATHLDYKGDNKTTIELTNIETGNKVYIGRFDGTIRLGIAKKASKLKELIEKTNPQ